MTTTTQTSQIAETTMATYRFTDLATRTVEWSSKAGVRLSATIKLVKQEWDVLGDGSYSLVPTSQGPLDVVIETTIDSKPQGRDQLQLITGHPAAVAKIGAIGLTADRLAQVEAAIAECEQHPEMVDYQARLAEGERVEDEYNAHVRAVESMMTVGGRSY